METRGFYSLVNFTDAGWLYDDVTRVSMVIAPTITVVFGLSNIVYFIYVNNLFYLYLYLSSLDEIRRKTLFMFELMIKYK